MNVPRLLLLSSLLSLTAIAGDPKPQDSTTLRKMAAQLAEEAKALETTLSENASAKARKFIDWTKEESELLKRSAEALDKNQRRLADRFEEKARDLCGKRGPLAEEVHQEAKIASTKVKTNEKKGSGLESKWTDLERRQAELDAEKKKLLEETASQLGQ